MFTKLLFIILVGSCSAVIYELNDADYALMPPLFHWDNYEKCFEDPEGLYCYAEYALVSDEPSELLTMMQEYSAHKVSHFNHTLLHYGICITGSCKKYYDVSKGDLRSAVEACGNESLYNKYQLKARVTDNFECTKRGVIEPIDNLDITVGVICVAILIINIVASICDYFFEKGKDRGALRFLYCFSIFRNWRKLVSSPVDSADPRLRTLKGLHGIRFLNMALVIAGHASIFSIANLENPEFVEHMFVIPPVHILLNGTVIMQTFLMISAFLLVYNWLIYSEKREPSWKSLPKQFLLRWLRLTPSYAVILALTATWFGRITTNYPLWNKVVRNEMNDCRRDWWKHLLYINNYYDDSECMLQAWYLAADTQLYYMAVIVFVMCRTVRTRKVVLSLLMVVGIVVPTLQTYYQNLDGTLVIFPEFVLSFFKNNPTFFEIYKRGHTNMPGYIIGMAMGYILYDWQKAGGDPKTLRKYRFLFWMLFPLGCLCSFTGTVYYTNSPPPSMAINLLFAAFLKPAYCIIFGIVIVGVCIQFEDLYRTILEWHVWTIPSRLSFSAYLLHIAIARNQLAMMDSTFRMSVMNMVIKSVSILINAFTAAFFFYILVEGPFGNFIRECFSKPEPIEETKELAKDSKKTKNVKEADESPIRKEVAKIAKKSAEKKVEEKVTDKSAEKKVEKKVTDKSAEKKVEKKVTDKSAEKKVGDKLADQSPGKKLEEKIANKSINRDNAKKR